jgi:hypothetical protein
MGPARARWRRDAMKGQMKNATATQTVAGKIGWILLWVLGVPIPVLLVLFLLRGCT